MMCSILTPPISNPKLIRIQQVQIKHFASFWTCEVKSDTIKLIDLKCKKTQFIKSLTQKSNSINQNIYTYN